MGEERFQATVIPSERGRGGHLVEVSDDVVAALGGGGRIRVRATFDGVAYRGSVVRMGGIACIGISKAILEAIGADYGSSVEVTLARDTDERTVEPPPDLAAALEADPVARAAWDRWSFTARKEHARAIAEAKKPETRARRLRATLDCLRSG
jgi:antitoxin component of MazEF toxin-antitoxin module